LLGPFFTHEVDMSPLLARLLRAFPALFFLASFLASPAHAAQIRLAAGDTITVQVVVVSTNAVIVNHPDLGRMVLKPAAVTEIIVRPAESFIIEQGPKLPLISWTAQAPIATTVPSPGNDPATAPAVQEVTTQAATSPSHPTTRQAQATQPKPDETDVFLPNWSRGVLSEWKSQLEIGAGGQSYVNNTANFRLSFKTVRANQDTSTAYDLTYYYNRVNGNNDKNELTTGLRENWLMADSPWYFFALGRYDYNQFGDWNHRLSTRAGPGYDIIKTPKIKLTGEMGFGLYKQYNAVIEDVVPEASLGLNFLWKPTPRQTLALSGTFLPEFRVLGRYRAVTSAEWQLRVEDVENLNFKIGIADEYASTVYDTTTPNNNFKFYSALVLGF
jgi:putative salt-induced outer membrane protein YdiY